MNHDLPQQTSHEPNVLHDQPSPLNIFHQQKLHVYIYYKKKFKKGLFSHARWSHIYFGRKPVDDTMCQVVNPSEMLHPIEHKHNQASLHLLPCLAIHPC